MAALMKLPVIFVYTHDSIGLGEDGPTHQPIEQLTSLRLIPNLQVWRPCDTADFEVLHLCFHTPCQLALHCQCSLTCLGQKAQQSIRRSKPSPNIRLLRNGCWDHEVEKYGQGRLQWPDEDRIVLIVHPFQ
jgi:hypothetical protein